MMGREAHATLGWDLILPSTFSLATTGRVIPRAPTGFLHSPWPTRRRMIAYTLLHPATSASAPPRQSEASSRCLALYLRHSVKSPYCATMILTLCESQQEMQTQ